MINSMRGVSDTACQYYYYADKVVSVTNQPQTEEEILSMQDIFLTPGFHCLRVTSLEDARFLVERYLTSLFCFKNVAVATAFEGNVPHSAVNLFEAYELEGHNADAAQHLEMSIIEQFYYDFLWIETSEQGGNMEDLYEALRSSNIHAHTPIVTFVLEAE
jgi:hypothetical protein